MELDPPGVGFSFEPAVDLQRKSTVYGLNGLRLVLYVSSLYHSLRAFPWRQSLSAQK